jgi:hypothetical protein
MSMNVWELLIAYPSLLDEANHFALRLLAVLGDNYHTVEA